MWYGMAVREQYRKQEIGKENKLHATCIRGKREKTKVKVVPLVISAFEGGIKEVIKELENMFEKDDLCQKIVAEI